MHVVGFGSDDGASRGAGVGQAFGRRGARVSQAVGGRARVGWAVGGSRSVVFVHRVDPLGRSDGIAVAGALKRVLRVHSPSRHGSGRGSIAGLRRSDGTHRRRGIAHSRRSITRLRRSAAHARRSKTNPRRRRTNATQGRRGEPGHTGLVRVHGTHGACEHSGGFISRSGFRCCGCFGVDPGCSHLFASLHQRGLVFSCRCGG